MRLLRTGRPGQERPCVLRGDGTAVDVSAHVPDFGPDFFAGGGLGRLRALLDAGTELPTVDLTSTRTGACVARPHKVICIGLNYSDHAAESGMPIPTEPIVFFKATNAVVGPDDDVLLPRGSTKTDWEVELAVVLGAPGRYLPDEQAALATVAGYAVANDVSERAFQLERGGQWVKGKSCETFAPLGPWLVTADEVPDPQALSMSLRVNGELRQDGSTKTMIFSVAHIVWYLSQFIVLEPGDVICTGTPPGVGMGQKPPVYLRDGDVMELEIEGLGRQRQVVRPAP
jgi:2,4-diketo-3-deoxy-L-fuconate hydrolase